MHVLTDLTIIDIEPYTSSELRYMDNILRLFNNIRQQPYLFLLSKGVIPVFQLFTGLAKYLLLGINTVNSQLACVVLAGFIMQSVTADNKISGKARVQLKLFMEHGPLHDPWRSQWKASSQSGAQQSLRFRRVRSVYKHDRYSTWSKMSRNVAYLA